MRYVCQAAAAMVALSFLLSPEVHGQSTQGLSITNYHFVSEQRFSRTQSFVTYSADLRNTGPTRSAVTGTVASLVPNVQIVPGRTNLHFAPVPSGATVPSNDTFTIFVDRSVQFDFSGLQWSFLAPVANAGPNQTVSVGSRVTVDGSASTNPTGTGTLSYKWAFVSRPPGTATKLENSDGVVATFVVDVPGNYVLSLTVSNGAGSDTAMVTVSTANSPPVAKAGPNQTVGLHTTVYLDGGGSSDVDGDALTFSWTLISRPAGSTATLSSATTISPTFFADMAGTYVAQLIVNDGKVNSVPSTVQISTGNTPPVANAGTNQIVNVGALVHMTGSGSTDVDGDPLTYMWAFNSLPSGSTATLSNAVNIDATFTADVPGTYVVQLIVNDGKEDSSPSTVTITTNAVQAPTANAGPNQTVQHGATVFLNGSATDPQGLPLTLHWSLATKPAGSSAVLSSTTDARPTFVADLPGTYIAQLIANNGFLNSAPSTVSIATTNVAPVANAGPDQSVSLGATVVLDGSGSSDADHDPLTYTWSLLSRPAGSIAALSDPAGISPTFLADISGIYVAQLIVHDGFTHSNPTTVTITAGVNSITLTPNPLNLATNSSGTLTVTLGGPAGVGGVVVKLASSDTSVLAVPPTVAIPENATSVDAMVTSGSVGSAFVLATATGFTPGSANVNVSASGLTLALEVGTVGVTGTISGTITLSSPAPAGGVVVNMVSAPAGVVNVTPSVTIASGSTGAFTVTGLAVGAATITANAPGYTSGSVNVTVAKLGAIKLPANVTVGPNQSASFPISLVSAAPLGGVTITLNNSDPSVVQIQQTVFIPQGQTAPSAQPQITGLKFGSATITASAPGFDGDAQSVQVTASLSFSPKALTVGAGGTANLTLNLSAPAPAGLIIALSSDNPAIATVPSSIPFPASQTSVSVAVSGVAAGSTTIHANSLPSLADTTAAVSVALLGGISVPSGLSVGLGQSMTFPVNLTAPAPAGGTVVTITNSDPSTLTISPSVLTIGTGKTAPDTQPQITGNAVGNVTLTTSAPAYGSTTTTVSVAATLSFSPPNITVQAGSTKNVMLSIPAPTPVPITLTLTSDNVSVAIVPSSITIPANATGAIVVVSGVGAGTTTIHATGANLGSASASVTVNSPGVIGLPSNVSVPLGQSVPFPVTLPTAAVSPVTVTLSSADGSKVSVSPTTVAIAAGQTTPATQPQITGVSVGSASITASATGGYTSASQSVQVTATLSFSPQNVTIIGTATQNITLSLSAVTPVPLVISLSSDKINVATVPTSVTIPASQSSVSVVVTGVSLGSAVIHASALPNVPDATANVTVQAPGTINLASNVSVSLGQSAPLAVTLAQAPAAPVTIALASSDASKFSIFPSTVTIAAGQTAPASQPQVTGVSIGSANITASAPNYTSATQPVKVTANVSFSPQNVTILGFTTQNVTLNLSAVTPIPVTVNLTSDNHNIATVPSTVTFPANSSSVGVQISGIAVGSTVIHASAPPGIPDATANVSVVVPLPIAVPAATTAPLGQAVQFAVSLPAPALSPVTISLSSSDASIVSVSPATVTIAAGATVPPTQPQATGRSAGAANITASATGFLPATGAVTVSAGLSFSPSNITLSGGASQMVALNLSATTVNPLTVVLTSDDPAVAKVPASVIIPANTSLVNFAVDGLASGTTSIHAAGPANVSGATATVTVQSDIILTPNITVAPGQQALFPVSLAKPAGSSVVYIQLTSSDTSKVTLPQPIVVIQAGQTAPTSPPRINGLNFGAVTITAEAFGLSPASVAVNVGATLSFSANPVLLVPGTSQTVGLELSAPAPSTGLTVTLSSSDPAVASVPASVIIPANQNGVAFKVNGIAVGQATITATTNVPTVPGTTTTATVGTPGLISLTPNITENIGSTVPFPVTLTTPAGANGVTVTLHASNANVSFVPLTCSGTPCPPVPPGATQTTVFIPAGLMAPASQPQMRAVSPGPVVITAAAPGYAIATETVQVIATFVFTPQNLSISGTGTGYLSLTLSGPAPPPPTGLPVTLTSSDYGVATVLSTLTFFWDGSTPTTLNIPVTGVGSGTAVIRASSPNMTDATATVTVSGPVGITTASPLPGGNVNVPYSTTVTAAGGVFPYTWSATGLPAGLAINASSGVISGTPTAAGTSTVAVTVTDSSSPTKQTATKSLSLTVAAGLAITTTSPLPNGTVNSAYSVTLAVTGGAQPYAWSATGLPAGLSINASTGVISGTPTAAAVSSVNVTVTDSTSPTKLTATKTLSLTVLAPLVITTASPLPGGAVNAAYSATVAATGGTAPYTWSAAGLPPGLSINATTGVISGTPTVAGTTSVNVTVTDSTNPTKLTTSKSLSVTIAGQLAITTTSPLTSGIVNVAYATTIAASGGTQPYAWSATGLPAGLTINATTGVISGAPTAAGTSTVAVTVTDATSPTKLTATKNLSLTIAAALAITTASPLPSGAVNVPYSTTIVASGGIAPYTWSATGLPAGLSINASTGAISGTTASASTNTVSVTVTDASSPTKQTATKSLSLTIAGQLTITTATLKSGVVNVSYSVTVAAAGGTTPYTWAATGLPAGLSINPSTGAITGTPSTAGTSTLAITVTDSTNPTHLTATANLSLLIAPALSVTTLSPLSGGLVGVAYSATVAASGGTTPYTWSATGLPAGLSINAVTGVISGTPTAAGANTVAVTVKDSTTPQQTATKNLSLTIAPTLSITTASPLPGGLVGAAYNASVAATGGTAPYTWSATGLPAGLGINATSGAITGTPTAAGSNTVAVTATDSTNPTHLTVTKNLTLTVAPALSITTVSPLAGGIVGVAYSATVAATGGTTPYTWSATGLPAGLTINSGTGVISGTPTAAGANNVAVTVTDATNPQQTATKNLSLTIAAALSIATASPLPGGVVGTTYSTTIIAAGGTLPYAWSATGLPAGLTINASTGVISGTPMAAGTGTAAVTVSDSTNPALVVTKNLSLTIIAPPAITTTSPLPAGSVNAPYSTTLAATGGTAPYTWSATGLPSGLSINASSGVISGTPTAQATATVGVTVTDSTNPTHLTATKNLALTIGPALPASVVAAAGGGQSAVINTQFASQLQAAVRDASNAPVSGVLVTFTAPASGQSLTFSTGGATANVTTNAAGIATAPVMTANGTAGSYTVSASVGSLPPANFALANTGVILPSIGVGNATVGQNLQTGINVTLPAPAGASDVVVTLTSSDPARLLLGGNAKSSIQATIPAGQSQVSVLVQALVNTGSVTVTAAASGYLDGTGIVTLTPSGFVLAGPNNVGASFQTFELLTTNMTVSSARLDAAGKYVEKQPLRASFGSNLTVTVGSTLEGTVTPASATFIPGDSGAVVAFKALTAGTATITAQPPAGFALPTDGSNTVTATILPSGLVLPANLIVGRNLQTSASIALNGAVGSGGATLTITSSDPTSLKFSTAPNTAGSASITLNLPPNAHGSPDFYVQGFASSGTVGYTADATGFGSSAGTVTLAPSGIVFTNSFGGVPNPILAAVGGSPVTVTVYSAILDTSGGFVAQQALAGGLSASVNMTSGNPSIGTVTPSQVTINGGGLTASTQFQPSSAGSTSLSVSVPATPAGFSTPSSLYRTLPVDVTTSKIVLTADNIAIGKDLQAQGTILLNQAAPAGGLIVTLTSNSGSLLLASGRTDAGQSSVQVTVPAGSTTANYYVQSIAASGTVSYTGSASGYLPGTGTITLTPSGVVLSGDFDLPFISMSSGSSATVKVTMAQLNPSNNFYDQTQELRGGLSLNVTLNTGNTGVATVDSPVTISGGADPASVTTLVHGVAPASTPLTAVQPAGFTPAANPVTQFKPMSSINVSVF